MKDFELKVGDLVKLRDDLIDGKEYDGYYFNENMRFKGFKQVEETLCDNKVIAIYNNNRTYYYAKQMLAEVKRPIQYETIYKREEPILDDKEKEYLSSVIKPFRDRVKRIIKILDSCSNTASILIQLNDDHISLPDFKENTMYKNMKLEKDYSLEELGL